MLNSKLKRIGLIFVVCLVVGAILKDFLLQASIQVMGKKVLGADVKIGKFALGLLTQKIHIKNLKIYNPPGFPTEPLLDMPEITVKYRIKDLIQGRLNFSLVVFNLKEVVVIENKEGKLNVDSLKIVNEQIKGKEKNLKSQDNEKQVQSPGANNTDEMKLPDIKIDLLKLTAQRVVYKNFSKSDSPVIQVFDIGLINKEIRNIQSFSQLAMFTLFETLKPTAIRKAGLFAATTLMGAGFVPAAILGVIVAKDHASAEMGGSYKRIYQESVQFVESLGKLTRQSESQGMIWGKIQGVDVVIEIKKPHGNVKKNSIRIQARKYFLAKPEMASGFLYQLLERLK